MDVGILPEEATEGFAWGLFYCEQTPCVLGLRVVSLEIVADEVPQLFPCVNGAGRDGEEPR